MTPTYRYLELLRRVVRLKRPRVILEWGTGLSTVVMAQAQLDAQVPDPRLVTLEHDPTFHVAWLGMLLDAYPHVDCELVELGPVRPASDKEASRGMGYATWPLRRDGFQPDLVFVDGRQRVDCVTVALDVFARNGLIVLHDAHRPNYQAALQRQDACEKPHTCYLRKYDAALITRRALHVVFDQGEGK